MNGGDVIRNEFFTTSPSPLPPVCLPIPRPRLFLVGNRKNVPMFRESISTNKALASFLGWTDLFLGMNGMKFYIQTMNENSINNFFSIRKRFFSFRKYVVNSSSPFVNSKISPFIKINFVQSLENKTTFNFCRDSQFAAFIQIRRIWYPSDNSISRNKGAKLFGENSLSHSGNEHEKHGINLVRYIHKLARVTFIFVYDRDTEISMQISAALFSQSLFPSTWAKLFYIP